MHGDARVDYYAEIADGGNRQLVHGASSYIDVVGIWRMATARPACHITSVFDGFACTRLTLIHDNTSSAQVDILLGNYIRRRHAVDI